MCKDSDGMKSMRQSVAPDQLRGAEGPSSMLIYLLVQVSADP